MKKRQLVRDASVWEDMAGETPLLKKLNSHLTSKFIIQHDVPGDECLREARELVELWTRVTDDPKGAVGRFLVRAFAAGYVVRRIDDELQLAHKPLIEKSYARKIMKMYSLPIVAILDEHIPRIHK